MTATPEVLGLLVDVASPVQASYVPTPPGLTVLYGLNGVGKSQVLRALESSLRGHQSGSDSQVCVVVRVAIDEDPDRIPSWVAEYAAYWASHDELVWTPPQVHRELAASPVKLLERAVADSLTDDPLFWDQTEHGPSLDRDELARQITSQGLLFVSADIMSDSHLVCIGALASDGVSLLSTALSKNAMVESASDDGTFVSGLRDPLKGRAPFTERDRARHFRPSYVAVWTSERIVTGLQLADVVTDGSASGDASVLLRNLGGRKSGLFKKGRIRPRVTRILEMLEDMAQRLLDEVLLDAPRLKFEVGTPADWVVGRPPRWLAVPPSTPGVEHGIDELSQAESRWCRLAIAVATQVLLRSIRGSDDLPLFLVLDEPEAHLHRSAEAHMAVGLERWATALGAHVVVASHSPELLDLPTSRLLHISRDLDASVSRVQPLAQPTKYNMAQFGLEPSDLLRRQRVFLLVEGAHDEIVLQELIGEELRSARVDIIPLRGAKQLPATVDSQFLFDYTDAHVVVLLDAIDAGDVSRAWARALETAQSADAGRAGIVLREALPGNSAEMRWMREFLSKAIDRGVHDRLTPFGLQALDVIDYLPSERLVTPPAPWSQLRDEWKASGTSKDFKGWLASLGRASFAPDRLRAAAQSLDHVPDELVALANLCAALRQPRIAARRLEVP